MADLEEIKLTLTADERRAFDWVGHRYSHGDDLCDLFSSYCIIKGFNDEEDDVDKWWGHMPDDITFVMPLGNINVLVDITDHIEQDNLACFAPALCAKLYQLRDEIKEALRAN